MLRLVGLFGRAGLLPLFGGFSILAMYPLLWTGGWGFAGSGGGGSSGVGEYPLRLPGVGGGHGELDAACADADQGADLQELQADGAAGGGGELGNWVSTRPMGLSAQIST